MSLTSLKSILEKHGQSHLLEYWDELSEIEKSELLGQLEAIDWDEIDDLVKDYVLKKPDSEIPEDLEPPEYFKLEPKSEDSEKYYAEAVDKARCLLNQGKIAAFTVAGGQGSRLGYDGPKGTFPITPVKNKTLFQYFSEAIYANQKKYGTVIPWYIMTSALNHEQTNEFFEKNDYFGLDKNNVFFFQQGTMPAIGYDGKLVLAEKGSLALAPNGHGGSLLALKQSGALDDMKRRGIEYISYFQVDNPLVSIINPLFIGLHCLEGAEMSAIVLEKTGPYEKLGNFCKSNGRLMIIEYSDLPNELAEQKNSDGSISFIAGSPAIHIISRDFVERLTADGRLSLPWHRADKKVPYISGGSKVTPDEPNAVKLETFIFDALPLAEKTVLLEAKRENEFAPTKNKTGVDSVESCREMMVARDARWLEAAGVSVPRDSKGRVNCLLELSPISYVDEEEVVKQGGNLNGAIRSEDKVYFE